MIAQKTLLTWKNDFVALDLKTCILKHCVKADPTK